MNSDNIYLVGGAVRDQLLNYPVFEKDWVVVGESSQSLLDKGFKQVGKDFPVFLHPQTGDEYALARIERKSGQGYYGFEVFADPSVTIEEDLLRRDLTINAIAKGSDGQLVDPYGGQKDIKNRILRHISPAFAEDPLRVLRVARFAARYAHLGFTIAPETLVLMEELSQSGELESLTAERVWKETSRAIGEKSPAVYFEILKSCGALTYWFSELDALWGIPNPAQWHPEIDTGVHTLMVIEQSAKLSDDPCTRFAALCHDLGKGITASEKLPSHPGHEKSGLPLVEALCSRLKTPKDYLQLAKLGCEFHLHLHKIEELKASTIVKVLERCDAFRKPQRFEQFLLVCEADYRGRLGFEERAYPQADKMRHALAACQSVDIKALLAKGFKGKQLGEQQHAERVRKVKALMQ